MSAYWTSAMTPKVNRGLAVDAWTSPFVAAIIKTPGNEISLLLLCEYPDL
jgi:hypothetical protein